MLSRDASAAGLAGGLSAFAATAKARKSTRASLNPQLNRIIAPNLRDFSDHYYIKSDLAANKFTPGSCVPCPCAWPGRTRRRRGQAAGACGPSAGAGMAAGAQGQGQALPNV